MARAFGGYGLQGKRKKDWELGKREKAEHLFEFSQNLSAQVDGQAAEKEARSRIHNVSEGSPRRRKGGRKRKRDPKKSRIAPIS